MGAVKPTDFTKTDAMRHSTAHVLAAAVMEMWPEAKLGVGPVIEHGFYYDVDVPEPITPQHLKKLEKRMKKIVARNDEFRRDEMKLDEAIEFFKERNQDYKVELLTALKEKGTTAVKGDESADIDADKPDVASVYYTGDFVDLCRGPHVASSKEVGAFLLTKIAGAYWRGKEENPQLQRIYGLAFDTQEELDAHLKMLEEAEKRDHRKLGRELELFTIVPEVGGGLPLFLPKGAFVRREMERYIIDEQEKRGYVPIWVPHITKSDLYKISGHLDKYDAMYTPMTLDEDDEYYLKPMNCPHFMMLYKQNPHSYRELPMRWTCTTTVYRYEQSGELSGLTRVRSITQDDCHVFCSPDQIGGEIDVMLEMIGNAYRVFGLQDFRVRISLRDPENKDKYIGDDEVWDTAETALREAVKRTDWNYEEAEDEAAFYGPKLDFMAKDAIGREWQLSTVQLDFNLPERFDLEYQGADGAKHRPVVIHRAILGATERMLGVLIEHWAGAFPVWLAPTQVQVIPVGKEHFETGRKLTAMLKGAGVRVEYDEEGGSVGKQIRNASKMKVPYMVVIGEQEKDLSMLKVRIRGQEEDTPLSPEALIDRIKEKAESRELEV